MSLSSLRSRLWVDISLVREGREQCSLPGVGAQNSGDLKSGKPSTIASPDCWDKRLARRRRGRKLFLPIIPKFVPAIFTYRLY